MSREEFIDNLRRASRSLASPKVDSGHGHRIDARIAAALDSTDLWLTRKSVADFSPTDFAGWSPEVRDELTKEVAAFVAVAAQVPAHKPATQLQSKQARKHLERVIDLVRDRLLPEWLEAQLRMLAEATAAAKEKGWYVERDEKKVTESLLGAYMAPRLRIRTRDNEVVLDPIACFGSGQQGVVDLVVMPTYETAFIVALKDGQWKIVSPSGGARSKPFNQKTLIKTIGSLANH